VRHGKPTEVQVELEFGLKSVKLVVRDDGTGFNVACPPRSESGFGLLGMRERAEQMGGVMKLRSLAGQGTEIIIELPVPDDSA
jgi:signal transduction histidine kinase